MKHRYTVVAAFTTECSGNPAGLWVEHVEAETMDEAIEQSRGHLLEDIGGEDGEAIEVGHMAVVAVDNAVTETKWAETGE